jgi:class 3 adenylate cyclase
MRAALLAHDEVLRSAIEAYEGFLFTHTGDGVVAAFSSPRSAVDAAVAAQRDLEMPVRMGIATGEAELRDGDYFGTVLNRAARLMAAGVLQLQIPRHRAQVGGGRASAAEAGRGRLTSTEIPVRGPVRSRAHIVPTICPQLHISLVI